MMMVQRSVLLVGILLVVVIGAVAASETVDGRMLKGAKGSKGGEIPGRKLKGAKGSKGLPDRKLKGAKASKGGEVPSF